MIVMIVFMYFMGNIFQLARVKTIPYYDVCVGRIMLKFDGMLFPQQFIISLILKCFILIYYVTSLVTDWYSVFLGGFLT